MHQNQMNETQHAMLMDIRRSIRYHDRRRAFFETMHRLTSVLTILLAGSVLFDIAKPGVTAEWLVFISLCGALLAAFDMVISYSNHANMHRTLKVRFANLEILILTGGGTDEEWDGYQKERLLIECDEPPIYRALDTLCHNELAASLGNKDIYPVSFIQRLTCQVFHWSDIAHT